MLWVPEMEDVTPPQGIVNFMQLEKELTRVFANAVMFNPELAENRGLGPAFRTRARTLAQHGALEGRRQSREGQEEGVKHEIGVARPEAGAIVKDAREMFMFVEQSLENFKSTGIVSEEEARDAPIIEGALRPVGDSHDMPTEGDSAAEDEGIPDEPRVKRLRQR